ncbi:MAG: hypothetical protein GY868_09210 [Deltaproteobacteria bacterium]|nr:hypothetical protein [Deltaproteobacteria bacterium]
MHAARLKWFWKQKVESLVHLENPRPLPLANGIFDARGQRQLALLNIFMTDKSAQPSAFSTQPNRKKDIVCKKMLWVFRKLLNHEKAER